jgi:hypothetical protein
MSFITFLIESILITFPTPILNHVFCSNWLIFIRFCLHYHAILSHGVKFASKKHEKIDETEQKTWFKIGVGKVIKIFSIRNVMNDIPWSLKVLSNDTRGDIPSKTHDFSCFFILSDHCRDFYRKCAHYDITSRSRASILRVGVRSRDKLDSRILRLSQLRAALSLSTSRELTNALSQILPFSTMWKKTEN